MFRYLIVLFLILLTDFSFGQIVLTETHSDAIIGIDRKAWAGLGNTSGHSDGYAHDFTLPARTNPCQQITGISVEIIHTNYTYIGPCPHFETYYNLFYGCTPYAGGATCLPASNLIAEPNFPFNISPPTFNFGNPLGSPLNSNIVPDFGDNLSIDIIPVSNPGCNAVTSGDISYQYIITVTVTVTDISPTQPPVVDCWDNFVFNTTTCVWDNTGTQPMQPPVVDCWDNFVFNTTTCVWDNTGTQPMQPPLVNCWDNFVFNTTTCAWDNTGIQPAQPPVVDCWDNFVFNTTTCVWDNTGTQPMQPPVVDCWDNFVFNTTTCVWDNTGTQPMQPPLVNCWDNFVFNTTTCAWDNTGTQPAQPPAVDCWDNFVFNTTTCVWDNTGTQPAQPPVVNCWDTFVFNTTNCVWDNTGTQPVQPMLECWETATFNNTSCSWDISGTQPGNVFEENTDLCANENKTLQAQTSISNPSYLWSTGEITESIVIANAGEYTVEITGGVCSFERRIFNVVELETPIIESVISDGRHIVVNTLNTGDFLYSIDGSSFQSSNTFFNVEGGLYTIDVRQRNCDFGDLYPHLHFFIPKYFTPNNDGVNDTFDLDGIQFYGSSLVSIYNRYGKLMRFSKNGLFSWDGTYRGEILSSDDYWYVIIIDGQKFTGHFTLKR